MRSLSAYIISLVFMAYLFGDQLGHDDTTGCEHTVEVIVKVISMTCVGLLTLDLVLSLKSWPVPLSIHLERDKTYVIHVPPGSKIEVFFRRQERQYSFDANGVLCYRYPPED